MHVRFSTVVGLPIVEEHGRTPIALLKGVLIEPDKGVIEGFYVRVPSFLQSEELFLPTIDITHWGKVVRVRSENVLTPPEDIIRLRPLLNDRRTMLGQRIRTEDGKQLGTCKDVQFNTKTFALEWLFPKGFLRWKKPISASAIVIVEPDAIVVKNDLMAVVKDGAPSVLDAIDPLRSPSVSGAIQRSKNS